MTGEYVPLVVGDFSGLFLGRKSVALTDRKLLFLTIRKSSFLNGFHKFLVSGPDNDFHRISFRADLEGALILPDHLSPVFLSPVEQPHEGQKRWSSVNLGVFCVF